MSGKYYIYWHLDPRTSLPVYAGKGKGDRALDLYNRHPKHIEWIKELSRLGLKPLILVGNHFESEEEAYEIEKIEIAVLRKLNCDMFNIHPGGAGRLAELAPLYCKKPIICLTNNRTYDSTVAASEDLGILTKRINDVLRGRKPSYKGYKFKYADEKLNEGPLRLRAKRELRRKLTTSKPIMCVETGKKYISITEAAKELNVDSTAIHAVLSGKNKRVKGLTFKRI